MTNAIAAAMLMTANMAATPVPSHCAGIAEVREHRDGTLVMTLSDGSSAHAYKTASGYTVTFLSGRGSQHWTRTSSGWSMLDLEPQRLAAKSFWDAQVVTTRTGHSRQTGSRRTDRRAKR